MTTQLVWASCESSCLLSGRLLSSPKVIPPAEELSQLNWAGQELASLELRKLFSRFIVLGWPRLTLRFLGPLSQMCPLKWTWMVKTLQHCNSLRMLPHFRFVASRQSCVSRHCLALGQQFGADKAARPNVPRVGLDYSITPASRLEVARKRAFCNYWLTDWLTIKVQCHVTLRIERANLSNPNLTPIEWFFIKLIKLSLSLSAQRRNSPSFRSKFDRATN